VIQSALVNVVVTTCAAGASTTGASSSYCSSRSSLVVIVGVGDACTTTAVSVTGEVCRAGETSRWLPLLPLLKTEECLIIPDYAAPAHAHHPHYHHC
jgi:hypothetical protein